VPTVLGQCDVLPAPAPVRDAAEARDTYVAAARAGLWATYVVAVLASAAIGGVFAGRGNRAKVATVTITGVVIFMAVVLPLSEGVTKCYANVTLVLWPSC
jgi:hypothetical protein